MDVVPGRPQKIFLASAETGTVEKFLPNEQSWEDDPGWSPDGKVLLFAHYPPGVASGRADDFSVKQCELHSGKISMVGGSEGMFAPRWSPDGRYSSTLSTDKRKLMLLEVGTASGRSWHQEIFGNTRNRTRGSNYLYFEDWEATDLRSTA